MMTLEAGERTMDYLTPQIVDYGTLVELTAANTLNDTEDGVGKVATPVGTAGHTDGTMPIGP